jgi:hypothetical protein
MWRLSAFLAVVSAAVLGASCGGSTFPSVEGAPSSSTTTGPSSSTTAATLTKAEYVARANAVCATGNARSERIGDPGSDLKTEAEAVDAGAVIATDTLRELRRLPVPDADAWSVETIYAHYDKLIKDAARVSAALRAGDLATAQRVEQDAQADESAADAAADAFGLTVCGSNSGSDVPSSPIATTVPTSHTSPPSGTTCVGEFPCGSGNSSIPSPSHLAASVTTSPVSIAVALTFQSPPDYLAWIVYRGDDQAPFEQARRCNCAGSEGHAFDDDIVAGHRYTYYVVATDKYMTAISRPASISVDVPASAVPTPPSSGPPCDASYPCGPGTSSIPSPQSVAASVRTSGQTFEVLIGWQPPPGYRGWAIYRGDDGTPFEQAQGCCGGHPGLAGDANVLAGHRYTYYVVTRSGDTFSLPTPIVVDVPSHP